MFHTTTLLLIGVLLISGLALVAFTRVHYSLKALKSEISTGVERGLSDAASSVSHLLGDANTSLVYVKKSITDELHIHLQNALEVLSEITGVQNPEVTIAVDSALKSQEAIYSLKIEDAEKQVALLQGQITVLQGRLQHEPGSGT